MPFLPNDILFCICEQLWLQRDLNTLFNLSLSSRQFALPALSNIYRMYDAAGVSDEVETGRQFRAEQNIVPKGTRLWRSLILSSLGKTMYPYSRYIRNLDLRVLKELLEDPKFRGICSDEFFAGDLSRFRIELNLPFSAAARARQPVRLNTAAVMEAIGDALTKDTPLVEDLDSDMPAYALERWLGRLPRLQQITVWNGSSLAGKAANLIYIHCPSFKAVRLYEWNNAIEVDAQCAKFLTDLRPQLEAFQVFSHSWIGGESYLALNCHRETLTELKLNNIKSEKMQSLGLLGGLTNLVTLHLMEVMPLTDLENLHNDVFLDVISWLRLCKRLKDVSFQNFLSGPSLLALILLENDTRLTSLEVTGYLARTANDFHRALSHQEGLQTLVLRADGEDFDFDVLVESLSKLNLKELNLANISDLFQNNHVQMLARNLPDLEELFISGWGITDAIWDDMAGLRSLRRLDINALSSFTADGILKFVSHLEQGNRGLNLAIMMADPDSPVTEQEQELIGAALHARVEGKMEYTLARDAASEDESDSD